MIDHHISHTSMYTRWLKRTLDFIVALFALVALSPLFLLTGLILRFTLGPKIIFRQERPGLHGKPFVLFKFRTMTEDRDREGNLLPDEERATLTGRVMRSLSLDEIPELVNVLRGEMSLVGPRPLLMRYIPRYSPEQARRHEARPGITGWAQINGRNNIDWDKKLAMDVWYVEHTSFGLDLHILFMTVWKVLRRDGIGKEGHFSSPEFMGPGS